MDRARRRLRVALVSEYYYPDVGGLPEHLHHLGRHLGLRGHDVTIVTTRFPGPPPPGGLPSPAPAGVVRVGEISGPIITNGSVSRAAVGLSLGRELRALFSARRFDVIHVHGPLFPTLPLLAIRHAPAEAALLATLHTHFPGSSVMRLFRRPLQRYLDALDGIIAVSESAVDSLRGLGLRLSAEIIENGVDLRAWRGGRPLAGLRDGALNLLVQARLEPRNHVALLIEALSLMQREPAAPRLRLLVVGDGPLRENLERAVPAALREADAVRFLGARIEGRPDLIASSDVYCFTAGIASHPMSLLEGMAAGLPVIAHDVDGVRQLLRDGVEGLLLPPPAACTPRACAEALLRLACDPALRRRLGDAARRGAEPYDWPRIAARIETQYLRVLTPAVYDSRMRRMSSRMRREPPPSR